jgi:hypothetical protein
MMLGEELVDESVPAVRGAGVAGLVVERVAVQVFIVDGEGARQLDQQVQRIAVGDDLPDSARRLPHSMVSVPRLPGDGFTGAQGHQRVQTTRFGGLLQHLKNGELLVAPGVGRPVRDRPAVEGDWFAKEALKERNRVRSDPHSWRGQGRGGEVADTLS